MRKLPILILTVLLLASAALAARRALPLLALPFARQGYENMIWMEQRTKIGKESVNGYLMGTGGADDALIGFELDDDWDMLTTTIGYRKSTPRGRKAEFFVEAGGKVLFSSGIIESGGGSQKIRVPLRGNRRFLLRVTAERYNDTAGAAFGAPTLIDGLTEEEMKNEWSVQINGDRTPVQGGSMPREISIPLDVPQNEEATYRVKIRRDDEGRVIFVQTEQE